MKVISSFFFLLAILITSERFSIMAPVFCIAGTIWAFTGLVAIALNINNWVMRNFIVSFILVAIGPLAFPVILEMKRRGEW